MLTDLSFLNPGAKWPPESEADRINGYTANRRLFEADHATVFTAVFQRLARTLDAAGLPIPPISYELVINYPKLVSLATANLLFSKSPNIVAGDESDTAAMQVVNDIKERSSLQNTLHCCAIDVSRFGDGILYIRRDTDGKGIIDISRPDVWYPVINAANLKTELYHVLATMYTLYENGAPQGKNYLRAEVHSKGSVEIRDYSMDQSQAYIGQLLGSRIEQTGLKDFAVIPVHNLITSDRIYGIDDYEDIQSMVSELEVRMAQISKVLDQHSNPSMQGPEAALTEYVDPSTGERRRVFKPGQYFVNEAGGDSGRIEYITWEAQLEANFKYIDKLIELIRVTSEMGALLSDMSEKGGAIPSGAAMRRMLYSAIAKISRIRNQFAPAIQRAFVLASELSGYSLRGKPLYIKWPETLPRDPMEEANVASIRTGAKQTQSTKRAIMQLDDLSEEDAEAELEAILDDQAAAMPLMEATLTDKSKDGTQKEQTDEDEGV